LLCALGPSGFLRGLLQLQRWFFFNAKGVEESQTYSAAPGFVWLFSLMGDVLLSRGLLLGG
jgi:hypothetical protein